MAKEKQVSVDDVTLIYHCPECGEKYTQPASELVENGIAFCTKCDVDCDLSFLTIKEE